jgi:hypothetical protein
MTIWRMRYAHRIPKATHTDLEYVIVIDFQVEQLLDERATMLRYTYIASSCYQLMHRINKRPTLPLGERLSNRANVIHPLIHDEYVYRCTTFHPIQICCVVHPLRHTTVCRTPLDE